MTQDEKERSDDPRWRVVRDGLNNVSEFEIRDQVVKAYVREHKFLFDFETMHRILDRFVPLWNDHSAQRIKNGSQEYEDIITGEELWASMLTNSES